MITPKLPSRQRQRVRVVTILERQRSTIQRQDTSIGKTCEQLKSVSNFQSSNALHIIKRTSQIALAADTGKQQFLSQKRAAYLGLLVDPVKGSSLVAVELLRLEPEGNLLLGVLDRVGAVADVAADIDGEVTTDGARSGGKGVGGTEEDTAGLDGVTALPDHGGNGAGGHVCWRGSGQQLGVQQ